MSGKKQHYIPQFLLRNFAERKGKKEARVFVYQRNGRVFRTATSKIAAERHFYSTPADDGSLTLDDEITRFENRISTTLEAVTSGADNDLDAGFIAEAIVHLCVRQAGFRHITAQTMQRLSETMVRTFSDEEKTWKAFGLHKDQVPALIRKGFEELYEKHEPKMQTKGFQTKESFVEFAFGWTKENFRQNFRNAEHESQRILAGVAKLANEVPTKAHIQALQQNLAPPPRVEHLAKMSWRIERFNANSLILPDCVAIGLHSDGTSDPLSFSGNVEVVVTPLRHDLAVVGHVSGIMPDNLSSDLINHASAKSSAHFFIARQENSIFKSLQANIGIGPATRIEEIFNDVITELDW